ncbi:hypothetical protein GCM10022255_058100 [Dactylosporangium darangshiense]|uniref:SARP family transcriptional regulator n=1 Tax=Dactylosporangium darangshiense TaxID=579108 RepID=A0ABP8DEP7_9ACTN
MEFGILGPLAVSDGGRAVVVSGLRAQRALAGLIVHAGQVVSIETLVDYVWDEPPPTARQQIHTVVYRLRRQLGEALYTDVAGYRLDLKAARLDAAEFAVAVQRGRGLIAADDLAGGARELRRALEMWRGRAFEGVPGERIGTHATRLEEERLAAFEECAEAELELKQHRTLIPQLQALAAEQPLREGLATLLVTALARDGRQADAIRHYHAVVGTLRDELGVEPGHRLQAAYLATLRDTDRPVRTPTRQLPRAPRRLVGREDELRRLVNLDSDRRVVVVDGMAGVGKTALVLTAAHALAEDFADLQLHIDLQGHSDKAPVEPHEALGVLLRRLGLRPPDDPDERGELWREHLLGRRGVIVLDNAGGAAQVEPLLPHGSPSVVLVTSRTRLAPIDGAVGLSLEPLAAAAGVALLRETTDERVDADPAAASAVVGMCGGLPLAIRLVGHRLHHRPRWTVGMLSHELASAELTPIDVSAEKLSVAAAFDVSYRQLDEPDRRLFRRLGLHPPGAFAAEPAAALAGMGAGEARRRLEDLVEVNLVQADAPGRYRLHDLLRAYAGSLVDDDERGPAIERMIEYYRAALEAAGQHLEIMRGASKATMRAAESALWVGEHWSVIVALTELAAQLGAHRQALALARLAGPSARVFGFNSDALRLVELVRPAVVALGDDPLAAMASRQAAGNFLQAGRYADCRAALESAEGIYRRLGDERRVREMQVHMVTLLWHEGRPAEALELGRRVAAAAEAAGEERCRQGALSEAAAAAYQLGRYELARDLLERVATRIDSRATISITLALGWLGKVRLALGDPGPAGALLIWAIRLKLQHGNLGGAAEALADYGRAVAAGGDAEAGLRYVRAAAEQAHRLGDAYFGAIIDNDLGEMLTSLGRGAEAVEHHERVLRRGEARPYERARAQAGIEAATNGTTQGADDVTFG